MKAIRGPGHNVPGAPGLGDFTTTSRVVWLAALAVVIGLVSAFVALALLRLIGIFTNLFFYQRWGTALVSPAGNTLGWLEVLVPAAGALVIGIMARYGSERIRGHGIPEAIEAILMNGSRIAPRVALLKPVSSAISIGSGGPFGAEGPIIMTGGAFGSLIAQLFHLSATERKTLLVAGAAGGMSATFAAPVSSALLAVELLLFEWKPRSFVPVALASVTAAAARRYLLGEGPLFPVPPHAASLSALGLACCLVAGVLAGALSSLLTASVYAAEDGFARLPIHWMWWPALGGLVVGLGGLVFPQALGVGYDTIGSLLRGDVARTAIAGILLVKSVIWAVSLGSGTSGGVLAPLLMMGGALGGLEAAVFPSFGPGFWPLISMGALFAGTMRSPLTGVLFTLEITHDINSMLPLLLAGAVAHGFTVLMLRRSILTEKISRRGYHLSREYAVDPLEILFVRDVMRTNVAALPARATGRDIGMADHRPARGQHLYPVIDDQRCLLGVITRKDLRELVEDSRPLAESARKPVVAWSDEPLRLVVYRMAETALTRMPVLDRATGKLAGMVSLVDLLYARSHSLREESHRERVLRLRLPFGRRVPRKTPPFRPGGDGVR